VPGARLGLPTESRREKGLRTVAKLRHC